jgi:diacylglycerol O-acyltransferase / wax synthase
MNRLRGLDATFLYLETPETPMHVAGLALFDLPESYGGTFYETYRDFLIGRISLVPILRQKLQPAPLHLDHPSWVADEALDFDYHIRRLVLPPPGNDAQLHETVARLHSILLDRSRPLWQFYVIEGLSGGRAALYSKIHHAVVDGGAGMLLTKAMYDIRPQPVPPPAPLASAPPPPVASEPAAQPSALPASLPEAASAVVDLYFHLIRTQIEMAQKVPAMLRAGANLLVPGIGQPGGSLLSQLWPLSSKPQVPLIAPRTIFNVQIASERSFAAAPLKLGEMKRAGKALGAKLNDVVMTVCAGGLRRYLGERDALPQRPLVAAVPVSLRELGNESLNNQVTMMLCSLATDIADPVARLKAITGSSGAAKAMLGNVKGAMFQDFAFLGAPLLLHSLMSLYGQSGLANWMSFPANVAISNVPGPVVPLYAGEAKVAAMYPVSIPMHGVALNITVQSYLDELDFGITADRRAVPDPARLLAFIAEDFAELSAAVRAVPAAA